MMGVFSFFFFLLPIKGIRLTKILENGDCSLANWVWMITIWVLGDGVLSILLLMLFIRPLKVIKRTLGNTPRSADTLRALRRMTEKSRNLLMCTVFVSIGMYVTILALGTPNMRTVLFLGAIDRLITLQCITMTFSYDGLEYFYLRAYCSFCYQNRNAELEIEEQSTYYLITSHNSTLSSTPCTPTFTKNPTDES